jgi:hypothetical protein
LPGQSKVLGCEGHASEATGRRDHRFGSRMTVASLLKVVMPAFVLEATPSITASK